MTEEFALSVINALEGKIAATRKAAAILSEITDPGIYINVDGPRTLIETFDPADPEVDGVPWLAKSVDTLRPLDVGHFPVVVHKGDEGFALTLYDQVPGYGINAAVERN
jgi:hypothetical protein